MLQKLPSALLVLTPAATSHAQGWKHACVPSNKTGLPAGKI
jgi:hypothetical protein